MNERTAHHHDLERFRVLPDEDSSPVRQWAGQNMFLEGRDTDERADWLDPDRWESFGVVQERRCSCCGQWEEVDSVWGFDEHESLPTTLHVGTFTRDELPEHARIYFEPVAAEAGASSLAFLATALLAIVPVSLVLTFVARLVGSLGVVA